MNIREQLQAAYLDYFNNYLTVAKYAEHNNITTNCAINLIKAGRIAHECIVNELAKGEPTDCPMWLH